MGTALLQDVKSLLVAPLVWSPVTVFAMIGVVMIASFFWSRVLSHLND